MEIDTDIFTKIPDIDWREPAPIVNVEEFRKVVMSRRSIRVFDGTPIPETVVNDCIDMALLAPNSSNLQPWEFYWVKTPEKKQKLVEACFSQPAARTADILIVCVARTKAWKITRQQMLREFQRQGDKVPKSALAYYEKLVPVAYNMGPLNLFGFLKKVAAFFIGFKRPIPREPMSESDMKIWAVKSCSLAAENLMLAFRAHGFDSCPMEGYDSARLRKIIPLESDAFVTMVIGAGKRSSKGVYGPRIRFKRAQFVKEI
ncbi:MAG: nitroreductase family protein [Bdellovibrionales bacterium]